MLYAIAELRHASGTNAPLWASRYEHHPKLCHYATFMLSAFVMDITDTTAPVHEKRRAVVLNCRLVRRGEGWATRQERLFVLLLSAHDQCA